MLQVIGCITQEHDLRLVVLAVCMCALACFTTINLVARAQGIGGNPSWSWLLAAAVVFGGGVWSLHFIAMLAFMPGLPITYDVWTTVASAILAMSGAMSAFLIWRFMPSRSGSTCLGGLVLGLAVAGMHYSGVEGMHPPGRYRLDHLQVLASAVFCVVFATVALARAENLVLLRRRVEASAWLGLCVCGVHFIGMSALSIDLGQRVNHHGAVIGSAPLAIALGSITLAILMVSLAATLMQQHLWQRVALELKQLQLLSDISQEILIIYRDDVILQVNEAGARKFEIPAEQLVGRGIMDLIAVAHQPLVRQLACCNPQDLKPEEIEVRSANGTVIPVEISCRRIDYEGKAAIVMALRDVSDRKRDADRIRYLVHHDALTDLPNRFLLQERLSYALDAVAGSGMRVALLYLDLDRFKPVNDLLGHAGGDALLIQVAGRLRQQLGPSDILARIGGDEFVIVVTADQTEPVADLAGRLIEAIEHPFEIEGVLVDIGTSIGIALYPADGASRENLMQAADTALRRAKAEERGAFRFFMTTMNDQLQTRRQIEQDLRHALERNEFELYYQPLVRCTTGEVDGFEALLRWRHPRRGLVSPLEFVPLAEETGLIVKISQWVIETACLEAARWDRPCRVAVNISPVQFRQSDLPQIVSTILARTGLAPNRLEIEITEGILMEDTARAVAILSALRAQGVRIALDDFGTGYSSLSYLRSFKFDKLKIDKSFITGLDQREESAVIVRTIIGLAHNLGLTVTAEGVETPQQLAMLRDHSCDHVQGYLLGRPMPMHNFTELTTARARMLLFGTRSTAVG